MDTSYLKALENNSYFSRSDLLSTINECGDAISDSMLKVVLKKLLDEGMIARAGRNAYFVVDEKIKEYHYNYSGLANELAAVISKDFPYLKFTIFELTQLNVFVNHQIAHNVVFVSVEGDLCDFVLRS